MKWEGVGKFEFRLDSGGKGGYCGFFLKSLVLAMQAKPKGGEGVLYTCKEKHGKENLHRVVLLALNDPHIFPHLPFLKILPLRSIMYVFLQRRVPSNFPFFAPTSRVRGICAYVGGFFGDKIPPRPTKKEVGKAKQG